MDDIQISSSGKDIFLGQDIYKVSKNMGGLESYPVNPHFFSNTQNETNSGQKDLLRHGSPIPGYQNSSNLPKNQSPLRQAHIISPSKKAPDGYVCVGRAVLESPSKIKTDDIYTVDNNYDFTRAAAGERVLILEAGPSSADQIIRSSADKNKDHFPSSFNPRGTANMTHSEKVTNWIQNVPVYKVDDEIWIQECYPPIPCSSSGTSEDPVVNNTEDILELQARRLTYYTTKLYLLEDEPIAKVSEDSDDFAYDSDGNIIDYENLDNYESADYNIYGVDSIPKMGIQTSPVV